MGNLDVKKDGYSMNSSDSSNIDLVKIITSINTWIMKQNNMQAK
jgi:hypothetical protein